MIARLFGILKPRFISHELLRKEFDIIGRSYKV